ncbi:DUF5082 domain-containing protein [Bacillus changyiensis]|uniref:DUF5082 domain-containing protein n=1 Tax=Bacillus changyiensis TaxID=3004103 RepID=UPI0022E1A905|nr:DUF5082 domain-containing protein [Bacillus changyiensis]MDA1477494.1 DUF5082 domain-containing protein [Bacillus changyiensis]
MSVKSALNNFSSKIIQMDDATDELIRKLRAAKKEIKKEHEDGIVEIRQILNPHLDEHWTGKFGKSFDKERDEAHTEMHNIVNEEYLEYIETIESEISRLQLIKGELEKARIATLAAHLLLEQGKKEDELNNKISSIKNTWSEWFS